MVERQGACEMAGQPIHERGTMMAEKFLQNRKKNAIKY